MQKTITPGYKMIGAEVEHKFSFLEFLTSAGKLCNLKEKRGVCKGKFFIKSKESGL